MGLCLPVTCKETDIREMLKDYLSDNETSLMKVYRLESHDDIEIRDLKLSKTYSTKLSVILFWCVYLLFCVKSEIYKKIIS